MYDGPLPEVRPYDYYWMITMDVDSFNDIVKLLGHRFTCYPPSIGLNRDSIKDIAVELPKRKKYHVQFGLVKDGKSYKWTTNYSVEELKQNLNPVCKLDAIHIQNHIKSIELLLKELKPVSTKIVRRLKNHGLIEIEDDVLFCNIEYKDLSFGRFNRSNRYRHFANNPNISKYKDHRLKNPKYVNRSKRYSEPYYERYYREKAEKELAAKLEQEKIDRQVEQRKERMKKIKKYNRAKNKQEIIGDIAICGK